MGVVSMPAATACELQMTENAIVWRKYATPGVSTAVDVLALYLDVEIH